MSKKKNLNALLAISVFLLAMASTTARATIYVDATKNGDGSNWPNAYKYLQDALTDAEISPDDIWVADGTYKPTTGSDRTASFQLINGVGVYGGFTGGETTLNERDWQTNVTILSGDLNGDDVGFTNNGENSYHVVKAIGVGGTAVLDGFTIIGGNANGSWPNNAGGGMYNGGGSPTVTNCTFSGNSADYGGGMGNRDYSSPTVTNCMFSSNQAVYGSGMYNYWSDPTVTNCTFSGNSAVDDGGGMYNNNAVTTVTNCTFSGNSATNNGGGMYNVSGSPTVTNCIFWFNSPSGITAALVTYSDVQGGYPGTGNIDENPLFVDADGPDNIPGNADDDLRLSYGSPCIDAGDNTAVPGGVTADLDGNPRFLDDLSITDTGNGTPPIVDMGAYEYHQTAIIFVDADAAGGGDGTSWGTAYKYLQDALAVAESGDKVWVAEGTYQPDANSTYPGGTNEREATFGLINGIPIYGGFPLGGGNWDERDPNAYETILSGDIGTVDLNTDNSYHVVTGSGTDASAVLDGFTITKGNANGSDPDDHGGGMHNVVGSPFVTNCTFKGNSANYSGGGMYNGGSSPTVTNCTFIGNSTGNYGGGVSTWGGSATLTNCIFSGNSANFGGGIYSNGSPTVTNCTFSGNSAGFGGGMHNYNSDPTVTNCTFSGNLATNDGGGVYNLDSEPNITNCILWGNTASIGAQIYDDGTSSTTVSYSGVEGGWAGATNIAEDPLFKDPNGPDGTAGTEDDDLSLSFDSPCIDAGDNNSVPADTADLDGDGDTGERTPLDLAGNARFTDDPYVVNTGNHATFYPEIVEMGAYERYEFCDDAGHPFPIGDISGPIGIRDCRVDFFDFAVVAAHWLEDTQPE